jgi:hypothetical protein
MAVRYAVATGNWSNTATWNGGTLPTAADDVYANNRTVTIDQDITVLSLRTMAQSPAVAGGGFICSTAQTITCTDTTIGILSGTTTCLTITTTSPNTVTINSTITTSQTTTVSTLSVTGNCTLNIVGSVSALTPSASNTRAITISSGGTLNIVGNLLTQGTAKISLLVTNNTTVNITGNVEVSGNNGLNSVVAINATSSTINITGNIIRTAKIGSVLSYAIELGTNAILNVTGNVSNDVTPTATGNAPTIFTSSVVYIKCIGSLTAGRGSNAIVSSNISSINIFSGPFISSEYGVSPFQVFRMNYFRTIGSYFEFRDETTNGALAPGPIAPATRLVSPDTIVDSPIPANVRQGVSYALGTFTGTLAVPAPGSVALNVPTDNTVGTAVLTPAAVWDYATASITDANSIGARLKNASTVDTTGEQLEAFLNA